MQQNQQNSAQQSLTEAEQFVLEVTGTLPAHPTNGHLQGTPPVSPQTLVSPQKQSHLLPLLVILGGAFLFLLCVGMSINNTWPVSLLSPTPVVTMAEFDQLRNGMSYEQVSTIIGAPGKLYLTSNQMPFRGYRWENPDNSSVTCQFMGNRLTDRSQDRLPDPDE